MEHLKLEIPCAGRTFEFTLCRRDLECGPTNSLEYGLRVPYYWMSAPELRKRGGGANARACVDMWWFRTEAESLKGRDRLEAETHLVLAELYPYVAGDRGPQRVFADALLQSETSESQRDYSLPDEDWKRLLRICRQRDAFAIDQEARRLLIREYPQPDEMPAYREAFHRWIGNGLVALRLGGVESLRRFVQIGMQAWIRKYRRRGNLVWERLFIDMFSIEAAAAFRVCYADAWTEIIAELAARKLLGAIGERFHGVWHNVIRSADGRDLLAGLVPALHPLSGRVMQHPEYREALRSWLSAANASGADNWTCPEFWNVFAVILAATAEYKLLHEKQNAERRKLAPAPLDDVQVPEEDVVADVFAAYAVERSLECAACSGPVEFVRANIGNCADDGVRVTYACTQCGTPGETEIDEDRCSGFARANAT